MPTTSSIISARPASGRSPAGAAKRERLTGAARSIQNSSRPMSTTNVSGAASSRRSRSSTSSPTGAISNSPPTWASCARRRRSSSSSIASRCRNSAWRRRATGRSSRPTTCVERVKAAFDPLPFWYAAVGGGEGRPLGLSASRADPAPDDHVSFVGIAERLAAPDSRPQQALCRHDHGARCSASPTATGCASFSHNGAIKVQIKTMDGVNPDTVWTWNAIGKRAGAWMLAPDAPEARKGFLLNHLISEHLPRRRKVVDCRTPTRSRVRRRGSICACGSRNASLATRRREPQFATLPRPPGLGPPPSVHRRGARSPADRGDAARQFVMTDLPAAPSPTRLGLVVDLDTCVGCHACATSCKEWNAGGHMRAADRRQRLSGRAARRVVQPRLHLRSRRTRERPREPSTFPRTACIARSRDCVTVCPTGASYKRAADGIVLIDTDRCIGCKLCAWACPYGAREFDEDRGVMKKCTLCIDRIYNDKLDPADRAPACVTTCPTKARHFGDFNDPESNVSRLVRERGGFDLRPSSATGRPANTCLRARAEARPTRRLSLSAPSAPRDHVGGLLRWVDRALSR